MTNLRDHAKGGEGPEITLTGDLPQRPPGTPESSDLVAADEISDEGEFPRHGQFLRMETQEGTELWECAAGLASAVVEKADEAETEPTELWVDVRSVSKTPDGEWRFMLEFPTDD